MITNAPPLVSGEGINERFSRSHYCCPDQHDYGQLLGIILTSGIRGVLIVAFFYLEDFRASLFGGLIPLSAWAAIMLLAPETQITILVYLLIVVEFIIR
jgi:hypothetical protein